MQPCGNGPVDGGQSCGPAGKRGKTGGVIAGLVPAISIGMAQCSMIGMAGKSPAMTKWEIATTFAPLTKALATAWRQCYFEELIHRRSIPRVGMRSRFGSVSGGSMVCACQSTP